MAYIERARRWGIRIGHSLNVVAELPRYVDDDSIVIGLRVAAVDAFFIHYRGLIEFLTDKASPPYIRSSDYLGSFDLQTLNPDLHARLRADWVVASQHVAHLTKNKRAPADAQIVEYIDAARLRRHASDLFEAMGAFIDYLANKASPYTADFRGWLREAESRATG